MNWTKDVPTVPGFYARRPPHSTDVRLEIVTKSHVDELADPKWAKIVGGEWCRLVPADGPDELFVAAIKKTIALEDEVARLRQEVEKAWNEARTGRDSHGDSVAWSKSRAKRVMEGME